MSSYVKRLEARRHVRRVPHPEDGRSYRLVLTPGGQRAFVAAARRFVPTQQEVEAALQVPTGAVQEALHELRRAVVAAREFGGEAP